MAVGVFDALAPAPAPPAPCSCMSYHHDSRRIFIGQDNGAVVVSQPGSAQAFHMLRFSDRAPSEEARVSGFCSIFGLLSTATGAGWLFDLRLVSCVCLFAGVSYLGRFQQDEPRQNIPR